MLLVGTIQNLQTTPKTVVLNFSSLNVKYPQLQIRPAHELGAKSDYEFDVRYAQYLMTDQNAFIDFMQIPYNIYLGNDVFILIDDSDYLEFINESLLKFLQQRYGLNATFITCVEDFINASECDFNDLGRLNFFHDKERLALMLERIRIESGGQVGGGV